VSFLAMRIWVQTSMFVVDSKESHFPNKAFKDGGSQFTLKRDEIEMREPCKQVYSFPPPSLSQLASHFLGLLLSRCCCCG